MSVGTLDHVHLEADFGYVIFVAIASIFLNFYLGMKVGKARKKYDVKYPAMYSDKDPMFNCIQRAHQNTLESYPQFLVVLFCSGMYCPIAAAVSGMVWIVGRYVYAQGYYTGDPSKRTRGAFSYLGLLAMLVMSIMQALKLLRWM